MLFLTFDPVNEDKAALEFENGRRVVVTVSHRPNGSRRKIRVAFDADEGVRIYRAPVFAERYPDQPMLARPPLRIWEPSRTA